jgi:hypothetical protein
MFLSPVKETMSRLIDGLKKSAQALPQPMGFRTSRQVEVTPKILIIASLEAGVTDATADSVDGADAILLHSDKSNLTVKTIQKIVEPLPKIPWGIYLEENDDKLTAAVEAGCDFVVFSAASRISTVPQNEKTGKILQVESAMDDGLLRAVNDLPVDALLFTDSSEESGALVWHQLMILQHLANIISKPLIVNVPANITEVELKALWEAGIDGVMVEVDITKTGGLKELRQVISKLPPRSARKRGRVDVLLPRTSGETPTIAPDEEEEEDD